ncbi:MAG: heparinase II/III family protein [Alistipes shahii]
MVCRPADRQRPDELYRSKGFSLYRILTDKPADRVAPKAPARNTSRFYPDAGFSLMHTDPADASDDLMAAFFALPFGSTGHAHAAHNGFTINYGGRQLFGGTGYYSNFNDKHTLMHYRSRGHNTILADGLAQVIGENGYGWLARFADNEALTYTLGDASHAYDSIRTPFWIDRMERSGVDCTPENGIGDPGVSALPPPFPLPETRCDRRLRRAGGPPARGVDMAAAQPQPHDAGRENALAASNGLAEGRMDLFTAGDLTLNLTDRFFSPAINWKRRTGPDGRVQEYVNQWHAEFTTPAKSRAQRFLAVFRITPDGRKPLALKRDAKGRVTVGGWTVSAELDVSKPASLSVTDRRGNAVLYNTPASETGGSTVVRRKGEPARELVDTVPASVR